MVYIQNWDEFQESVEKLYHANPAKVQTEPHVQFLTRVQTRYSCKYRHADGKLVLKVTDDSVVSVAKNQLLGTHTQIVPQVSDRSESGCEKIGEAEQSIFWFDDQQKLEFSFGTWNSNLTLQYAGIV
jgi:hypothetical protein